MSTIKVNSIEPANAGSEDYFLARAWVNFNGSGTVAIRGDGNVSSITDNGTGDYTVNFTNALADANFAISGAASWWAGSAISDYSEGTARTASSVRVFTARYNGVYDAVYASLKIMR